MESERYRGELVCIADATLTRSEPENDGSDRLGGNTMVLCPTALHTSRWTAPSASSAMRLGTASPVFGTSRRQRQTAAKPTCVSLATTRICFHQEE